MTISYNAFGVPTYTSGSFHDSLFSTSTVMPFMYKGYYYDSDLGMYYLISRYYDPATGRFISPDDPNNMSLTQIGGISPYTYCFNNPVSNKIAFVVDDTSNNQEKEALSPSVEYDIIPVVNTLSPIVGYISDITELSFNYWAALKTGSTYGPVKLRYFIDKKSPFKKLSNVIGKISLGLDFYTDYANTEDFGYATVHLALNYGLIKISQFGARVITKAAAKILTLALGATIAFPAAIIIGAVAGFLISYFLQDELSTLADNIYNCMTS